MFEIMRYNLFDSCLTQLMERMQNRAELGIQLLRVFVFGLMQRNL